jgi:LAGLIDADG endonuclease
MSLAARDDDADLIHELATRTRLGRITRTSARKTSKPQVAWTVTAKADCVQLIELLDGYPLRGRKSRDYAIWSAAVRWWATDDPTRTIRFRDWEPMIYLKGRLHEVKAFSHAETRRIITDDGPGSDWMDYLAGLVTAEGTLGIHRNGAVVAPKLVVSLRADDRPLLEEIRRRTAVGSIYWQNRLDRTQTLAVGWFVRTRTDLFEVVELLDGHPPRGRKRKQYEIWREAVLEYANSSASSRSQRMARLRDALADVRRYPAGIGGAFVSSA